MRVNFGALLGVTAAILISGFSAQAQRSRARAPLAAATPLEYELSFEKPNTHLVDVSIRGDGFNGRAVEFAIPNWAPGSYYIMNYSAEVQGFHATAPDGGRCPRENSTARRGKSSWAERNRCTSNTKSTATRWPITCCNMTTGTLFSAARRCGCIRRTEKSGPSG